MMKNLKLVLKLFLTAGFIAWLVSSNNISMAKVTQALQPMQFLACTFLLLSMYFLANWRWLILLRSQGFSLSFGSMIHLMLISLFFNTLLPGGISGDIIKGYYLAKENKGRSIETSISILMDRVIGLFALLCIALVTCLFHYDLFVTPQLKGILFFIVALFVGYLVAFSFIFYETIAQHRWVKVFYAKIPGGAFLEKVHSAFSAYKDHKMTMLRGAALGVLGQVAQIVAFIYLGRVLGVTLDWSLYFLVVPLGVLLTTIPISPGGVGFGQAVYLFLFGVVSQGTMKEGANIITTLQIVNFFIALVSGLAYLKDRKVAQVKT